MRFRRLAVAVLIGSALAYAAVALWPRSVSAYLLPVFLFFSSIAGIVVHEAGHLCAGLLVRFRPTLMIVGPVRLRRMPSGWKFETGRLGFLGGAAVSMPEGEHDLRRRLMFYVSGGAAANVLCAVIAASLAHGRDGAGVFLAILSLVSVCFSGLAMYPLEAAGVHTDGSRFLQLWRGGPEADRWLAAVHLVALSFQGARPAEWPEEWVRRAVAYRDVSADGFQSAMIGYSVALDRGDLEAARHWLWLARQSLDFAAVIARPEYYIEKAFLASVAGDIEGADAALANANGGLTRQASLLRAKAAREFAAGNKVGNRCRPERLGSRNGSGGPPVA
jgi:hypothetical protein